MAAPEVFSLGQTRISSHAFNADRSRTFLVVSSVECIEEADEEMGM